MNPDQEPLTQTNEDGEKQSKRSTKAELQQRVEEVLRLRLNGAEFYDLRQYASENQWDVSERQLWRYVAKADECLEKCLEKDRDKLLNRQIAIRQALYARAMAVSDYSTALRVMQDECNLLGLYHPPKKAVHPQWREDGGLLILSGFDPDLMLGKKLTNPAQEYPAGTTGAHNRIDDLEDGD